MSSSSGSLPRYIVQRLLLVIPMMWILMTLVFLLLRVAPGDPVSAALGGKISPQALESSKEQLGLNKPLIQQYWDYLWSVVHLNFGTSFTDNQPIIDVIKQNGGATLSLTTAAFLVAVVVGIPLGLIAGRMRDTPSDVLIRLFGIITYATPIFFAGLLVQVHVAPALGLPTGSDASPETTFIVPDRTHILLIDAILSGDWPSIVDVVRHLILPSLVLGIFICGVFIRLVRINILQTNQSDYVEAATARGVSPRKVTWNHAFRNALVPVITVLGLQAALLLGGAVLTETTFNWPGIGLKLVKYINGRDYGAVQGIVTFFGLVVIVVGLIVDIINALIDPRVRY
ncbi:MAG TPA: ABC transporter permease [Nocardioidaceae bacterium]|nr:ABC transporter permease [Nocardioidaceae bacterium]